MDMKRNARYIRVYKEVIAFVCSTAFVRRYPCFCKLAKNGWVGGTNAQLSCKQAIPAIQTF